MTDRFAVFVCLFAGLVVGNTGCAAEAQSANHFFATEPVFDSRVYIEQWGNPVNPPVVLVHGLGDNGARDWRYLMPKLAENYHVLAFDLPGFGRSGKDNLLYSPESYTRFVRWVTDTYVDRPFVLIGHSMGGAISLNYAATYPDHLARLILIDAAGILHRAAFSTYLFDELKPARWWDVMPATNSEKLRMLLGIDIVELEKYQFPIERILYTSATRQVFLGGNPIKIAGLALVQHNFSGLLERVTTPTLIIWGEHDAVAPLRTGKLLAARISDARLEVIRGARHIPMIERPRELNQLILNELAEKTTQPDPADTASRQPESTAAALADTDPAHTDRAIADRTAECLGENDQYFSGNYTTVTIVQCKRVLIEHATIDFLEIRASSVEIINSHVGRNDKALQIDNSILVATATEFSADVPIIVTDSRLDFAGTTITAGRRPFEATGASTALFSVSELRTLNGKRWLHGVFGLSASQTLQ